MILIDTHTHLYSKEFDNDRAAVVQNAIDAGVEKLLLPNIDIDSIMPMHQLCSQYPNHCFPMMGLHPTSVDTNYKENLIIIKSHLKDNKYIAIGEVGIDLYWDKTFAKEQRIVLLEQFQWAIDYNLPVVIHSRDSFNVIIDVIKEFDNPKLHGVFHCFTGKEKTALEIINLGFKLGIGGVLTFKNSGLANEINNIDLKDIILETDSPYLSPALHRGKRNESSYVRLVAEKLAEIKQVEMEEVANITTHNAKTLFNI